MPKRKKIFPEVTGSLTRASLVACSTFLVKPNAQPSKKLGLEGKQFETRPPR
jgi:hypothetical protein